MSVNASFVEPSRVDEPRAVQDYSDMLTQVAAERRPVIVCRNGEDLAAVVSLDHLELLRETLAREEVERQAATVKWDQLAEKHPPPQSWFDDNDNPFEAGDDRAHEERAP